MAASQDALLRTKGFICTITENVGASGTGENESWLSCSGGADVIEVAQTTIGTDVYKTFAPGQTTVSPLVLEGYLTADRKAMITWIQTIADGNPARRDVSISPQSIEQKPTKMHNYYNCLLEEYVYPELSSHDHNTLKEKVTIRPERHDITG